MIIYMFLQSIYWIVIKSENTMEKTNSERYINTCISVENYILDKKFYMRNIFDADRCSAELNISPYIFNKALKQCFSDINLKRLATQLRIEDAKDLLSCKFSIGRISKLCGFSNILSFIYYFKKETGQFPLTWRRNMC